MVHEEQGSLAMVAPQWPPQEAAGGGGVSQRGTHDFMAKCARAGGRSVEWPPRNEEGVAVRYGSNPALSSGQQQVAPPPVPPRPRYYPLNKAHSSAPNLLEDSADPNFGKSHPAKTAAIPTHTTGGQEPVPPSRAGVPQPQSNMASQHSMTSSSSQQQPGDSDGNLTTVYPSNFKLRSEMPVEQEASKVYQSQPAFKCTKPIRMRGDNKWPPTGAQQDTSEPEVREFIKPRKQCKDYSGFFAQNALPSNYTGYRAPPGTQHVGCEEDEGTSEM